MIFYETTNIYGEREVISELSLSDIKNGIVNVFNDLVKNKINPQRFKTTIDRFLQTISKTKAEFLAGIKRILSCCNSTLRRLQDNAKNIVRSINDVIKGIKALIRLKKGDLALDEEDVEEMFKKAQEEAEAWYEENKDEIEAAIEKEIEYYLDNLEVTFA